MVDFLSKDFGLTGRRRGIVVGDGDDDAEAEAAVAQTNAVKICSP